MRRRPDLMAVALSLLADIVLPGFDGQQAARHITVPAKGNLSESQVTERAVRRRKENDRNRKNRRKQHSRKK